jgi:hypothetical protein
MKKESHMYWELKMEVFRNVVVQWCHVQYIKLNWWLVMLPKGGPVMVAEKYSKTRL